METKTLIFDTKIKNQPVQIEGSYTHTSIILETGKCEYITVGEVKIFLGTTNITQILNSDIVKSIRKEVFNRAASNGR